MNNIVLFALMASLTIGCTNTTSTERHQALDEKTVSPKSGKESFEIIDELKSETSGKAQLVEYAVYKDSVYSQAILKNVMLTIYNQNRDKRDFANHDKATVLGVYLFTSKDAYKDKSNWIAMLIKRPGSPEPEITFNDFKIRALGNLADQVKDKDEVELGKLKNYLEKRGLDLCSLSDLLKKIELGNIHKADAQYPDYGDKHMAMIKQLDKESYRDLKRKYSLSEDMLSKVSIFAMSYCK